MAKPRLWLPPARACAAVITASAGAWLYQIQQRQDATPPNRVGPWSLGEAFEPPPPETPHHAIGEPTAAPKRAAASGPRVAAAVAPPREGLIATDVAPAVSTEPVELPIAALGKRVDMSPRPINIPVVVPHADQLDSELFAVQQRRSDTYVPGNLHGWIGYEIAFDKPLLLRAGGELRAGLDAAGPGGLPTSEYEKGLAVRRADFQFRGNSRVMNTAPYLSLIGRICSRKIPSPPFLVGSGTVLCPSPMSVKGELQAPDQQLRSPRGIPDAAAVLARIRRLSIPDRSRTRRCLRCGTREARPRRARTSPRSTRARQSRDAGFIVSSRQTSWKPFFLPLDRALVIRASGYMQPREAVTGTDPNGIAVPEGRS